MPLGKERAGGGVAEAGQWVLRGGPLGLGQQAAPVGAEGCGPDASDAACLQKVLMQLGKCDAFRRASG